jgi:hypothetical protein
MLQRLHKDAAGRPILASGSRGPNRDGGDQSFYPSPTAAGEHAHHVHAAGSGTGAAFLATSLHAVAYLAVTAFVAVLVFEKVGVGILRRAWINLDLIWSGALVATGTLTLMR